VSLAHNPEVWTGVFWLDKKGDKCKKSSARVTKKPNRDWNLTKLWGGTKKDMSGDRIVAGFLGGTCTRNGENQRENTKRSIKQGDPNYVRKKRRRKGFYPGGENRRGNAYHCKKGKAGQSNPAGGEVKTWWNLQ